MAQGFLGRAVDVIAGDRDPVRHQDEGPIGIAFDGDCGGESLAHGECFAAGLADQTDNFLLVQIGRNYQCDDCQYDGSGRAKYSAQDFGRGKIYVDHGGTEA